MCAACFNLFNLKLNFNIWEWRKYSIYFFIYIFKSKLQVLSFMFVANCRRCPLPLKLMTFALNVLKSCTLCPLSLTHLIFFVKFGHPGLF
ncbi:hypothetical protein Hanom_Chr06g00526181 [Helianthus anomalus]